MSRPFANAGGNCWTEFEDWETAESGVVGKGEAVDDANEEGGFTTDPNGKAAEAAPGVVVGTENIEISNFKNSWNSSTSKTTAQNVFSFKN